MGEYIAESEVLRRALGTYGSVLQIVVTMEEMSELQKELCKDLRGRVRSSMLLRKSPTWRSCSSR